METTSLNDGEENPTSPWCRNPIFNARRSLPFNGGEKENKETLNQIKGKLQKIMNPKKREKRKIE